MTQKGVLKGKKISTKHSTFIPDSIPVIRAAKALPEVTRVVLGEIVNLGGGKKRIKFMPVQSGWRVVIRGSTSQQTLYVYTNDPKHTQEVLSGIWDEAWR